MADLWGRGIIPRLAFQFPFFPSLVLFLPPIGPFYILIPEWLWRHRMPCRFYRLLFLRCRGRILLRDGRRFQLCGGHQLWIRRRCRGSSRLNVRTGPEVKEWGRSRYWMGQWEEN